jgi:hypothetical protein
VKREEFIEKSRDIHGYKYEYVNLPEKITLLSKINMVFKGVTFSQVVNKHLMGRCPEKSIKSRNTSDFIDLSNNIWNNKYNYSLSNYKNSLTKIKIIRYGIIYEQIPTAHLNKKSPEFRIINNILLNRNKLVFKSIEKFLRENNIDFKKNYQMGATNISFDFFLFKINTVVDFDISGYYTLIDKEESYESLKTNDKIKNDYCEDNYIDLIRIRYDQIDRIFDILKESLKNKI